MKNLRSILSLMLVLMVFLSSTGFTFNAHFCAGDIKTIGVLQVAKKCNMHEAKEKPDCHKDAEEDNCCQEKSFEIEAKETTATNLLNFIEVFPTLYVLYDFYIINFFDISLGGKIVDIPPYLSPPYKFSEIHILNQSFLI